MVSTLARVGQRVEQLRVDVASHADRGKRNVHPAQGGPQRAVVGAGFRLPAVADEQDVLVGGIHRGQRAGGLGQSAQNVRHAEGPDPHHFILGRFQVLDLGGRNDVVVVGIERHQGQPVALVQSFHGGDGDFLGHVDLAHRQRHRLVHRPRVVQHDDQGEGRIFLLRIEVQREDRLQRRVAISAGA